MSFAIAVQTDGSVWVWGFNEYGQLGNGGLGEVDLTYGSGPLQKTPCKLSGITAATPGSTSSTPSTPNTPATKAVLSPQRLIIDGRNIECEKYNIDGSNYFKLRDLAYALNGTGSQFGVGFDAATSTVSITTGSAYEPTGSELETGVDNSAAARPSAQSILINGSAHSGLIAYNIGGSNFFQLRELGNVLGFEVDFDAASNTAIVRSVQ